MEGKNLRTNEGVSTEGLDRVALYLNHPDFSWNLEKLKTLFDENIVAEICNIQLYHPREDKLIWTATNSRVFSPKSVHTLGSGVEYEEEAMGSGSRTGNPNYTKDSNFSCGG